MQKFNGSLVRQFPSLVTGNAGAGVSVTVYAGATGSTLAPLFSGNGTGSLSNPLTTDSAGYYGFYAADGVYRLDFGLANIPDQLIQLVDVAEIRDDFDTIESNNAAFLVEQQANYDAFVLSQGWDQVGTFAAGFAFESPNQVGQDVDGNWWRWNGAFPKVVTAGTLPSSDPDYKLVGDGVLRSDLATTDSSVLVGGNTASDVNSGALNHNFSNLSPVMLEQFINGFGGRGMLADETPNLITEQFISSSAGAGATSIGVAVTTDYAVGSRITIYHDTVDRYETYFVNSKSASTLGLSAGLLYPVTTNSKIERAWFNQPHPGKFYMRQLAQRIAREPAYNLQLPTNGRLFFAQFDSDPSSGSDIATGVSGGSVSYVNELNVSQGSIAVPLESSVGRALFIEVDADGEGAELQSFNTYGATNVILRLQIMSRNPATVVAVQLVDDDGFVQTEIVIPQDRLRVSMVYSYPVKLSARTVHLTPRIVGLDVPAPTSIIVDQFEIFNATANSLPVIPANKRCVIVGLGDSWIAGDISNAQRESILTQLAIELPLATIINKGVGGQKVWEMYDRFETDVAVHKPDYVIVNTGTNDSYSPISGTFFPNSVDHFERYYNLLMSKIMSIGAKPIIISVPALAEEDGPFLNWALNDRAKTYNRYFTKRISAVVDYTAAIPEPVEPVITDFTPVLKIDNSETGITYSSRAGKYAKNGRVVTFTIIIELSNKGASTGFVTVDMPPISNNGGTTPFNTTCANVNSALGMQAVGSISATGQMRLQIPIAEGTSAATEANINNNTTLWISGSYLTNA